MPGASPYERDLKFEDSLRPGSFDEFIGQRKAVANLQIAIQATRIQSTSNAWAATAGGPRTPWCAASGARFMFTSGVGPSIRSSLQ